MDSEYNEDHSLSLKLEMTIVNILVHLWPLFPKMCTWCIFQTLGHAVEVVLQLSLVVSVNIASEVGIGSNPNSATRELSDIHQLFNLFDSVLSSEKTRKDA